MSRADSGEELTIAERTSRIFQKGKLSYLTSPESKEQFVNILDYYINENKHEPYNGKEYIFF